MTNSHNKQAVSRNRVIVSFPVDLTNPYQKLFYAALRPHGFIWDIEAEQRGWRVPPMRGADILHLHWDIQDLCYDPHLFTSFKMVIRLLLDILHLRKTGKKLVWTCHNLRPHEPGHALTDWLARFLLAQLSHVVLSHCQWAKQRLRRRYFRRRRVYFIPFGPYRPAYRAPEKRSEARAKLGIDENTFVYLFFGTLREYKGIPELMQAFQKIARSPDRLLIVGRCNEPSLEPLLKRAAHDSRITIVSEQCSDDTLVSYLAASNVMVVPFRRMTTSSSVILALNYGLPVITPGFPFIHEIMGEHYPLLYPPNDSKALADKMVEARSMGENSLRALANETHSQLSWEKAAEITAKAFHAMFNEPVSKQ